MLILEQILTIVRQKKNIVLGRLLILTRNDIRPHHVAITDPIQWLLEIFCIVESILLRFKAFNLLTKPFLFRLSRKKKICKNMEATDSSLIHICSP